jgi:alkane 1-monooxygenase
MFASSTRISRLPSTNADPDPASIRTQSAPSGVIESYPSGDQSAGLRAPAPRISRRRWRSRAGRNFQALGYAIILLPPLLVIAASRLDLAWLVVGTVVFGFPLARWLFGAMRPGSPPPWSPLQIRMLESLPLIYVPVLMLAIVALIKNLTRNPPTVLQLAGWTMSLWLVFVFGTCVAHALLHSPMRARKPVGHGLAGICGYPILGFEHARHHRLCGSTSAGEAPGRDEPLWAFIARRIVVVASQGFGSAGVIRGSSPASAWLRGSCLACLVTACTFGAAAGWYGAVVYGAACLLVALGVQAVTYLQHWGLGDDTFVDARQQQLAWEDDCRFQAWITLGLSLHQSHHHDSPRPYYRIGLQRCAPRPPAGYLVLLAVALVPAAWLAVMRPALQQWRSQPHQTVSAGRSLVCWNLYRHKEA